MKEPDINDDLLTPVLSDMNVKAFNEAINIKDQEEGDNTPLLQNSVEGKFKKVKASRNEKRE